MSLLEERAAEPSAPPSPAGPAEPGTPVAMPPALDLPPVLQTLRFAFRPRPFLLGAQRDLGDVLLVRLAGRTSHFVVTNHPDHARSLFTAAPDDAPSLTGQSPLRPIVGPDSVLTAVGARHLRQRKLLLPPFHGEAIARYTAMITEVAEREVAAWPVGRPFPLAARMQAVTLDVILSGVFGIDGRPAPGTPEHALRRSMRRFLAFAATPAWQAIELQNLGQDDPRGPLKLILRELHRRFLAVIAARRATDHGGTDVLSLLLSASDDEGRPLTDAELRDELLTLVLAGHETTANSLAWTFERLLRTPHAYDRLREEVRGGGGDAYLDATIHEAMRARPVIPMVGRLAQRPWRLGDVVVPAGTPIALSITGLHHRPDLYPDPFAFRPERFLGRKPGTYTWIPFGGGIRRCLGAALAMAEQRVVLRTIAERTDLRAPDLAPERGIQRNVTTIPGRGGLVEVVARR